MCRMLGYPHPDFLLPLLTWEQWREWQLFLAEEHPEADQDISTWSDSRKLAEIEKLNKFQAELAAKKNKHRTAGLTNEPPPIVEIHG